MKVLALETTGMAGSVAALDDDRLLAQTLLPPSRRSAQSLAPALAELLRQLGWRPREVELIALPIGPGSFTGLRVGVTAAKTLAYLADCPLAGINTLEVIAEQAPRDVQQLWAVVDAYRGQVFAGRYRPDAAGIWRPVEETAVLDQDAWLARLEPGDAVSGPGLARLQPRLPSGVASVEPEHWQPMAATVGRVGYRQFREGRRHDPWNLLPNYYRASAAEEKLDERNRAGAHRGD